jgi:phage terminase large subunit-like protein
MPRPATSSTTSPGFSQPVRSPDKDCLEHFVKFCAMLRLPDTLKPFVLEDWQQDALRDYFEHGALEHLWEWPTGMGKSTLLGALALHHGTFVRVNPKVIVLGGMGGHAKHTLQAASWFISQNKSLQYWWVAQEYGMGRIKSLITEDAFGVITITSAGHRIGGKGGTAQEGEAPSLVLVEELHRHEDNGAAVRTLTTKVQKRTVGAHKVRIVHVTTAGDSRESPLGRLEARATTNGAIVTHPRPGMYYDRGEDADGDVVMHRWAVPEHIEPPESGSTAKELDRFLDEVKKANPATFIQKPNLRRSWKASSSEPWVFLRQHANQWITQHQTAISRFHWMTCANRGVIIPPGAGPVYLGLDTALSHDTTALVPVWHSHLTDRLTTAGTVVLKSEVKNTKRRMRDVIDVIEVMRQRWPDLIIVFDRNMGGGLIAEQLEEDHGLSVIDHGQGLPMESASMLLGELVANHLMEHDGSELLTSHVLSAVAKPTSYGKRWRLEKPRSGEPIDGAAALAMALNAAHQDMGAGIRPEDYRIIDLG